MPRDNKSEAVRNYHRKWKREHPEQCSAYTKKYRANNPDKFRQRVRKWVVENYEHTLAYARRWQGNKRRSDSRFKIERTLRNRLYKALRQARTVKIHSALKLVGCGTQFLMGYIAAKFKPGMSWTNYGSVWEIDHEIPCSAFDLSKEESQMACFHYSNLQPLFVSENRRKHCKVLVNNQN